MYDQAILYEHPLWLKRLFEVLDERGVAFAYGGGPAGGVLGEASSRKSTNNGAAIPPLVGVMGAMGPLSTVDFLHKLVDLMPAAHAEDHVPCVVWNVRQIPTARPGKPPARHGRRQRLNAAGATRIVIPCNTAHVWYDGLQTASSAPFIHIAVRPWPLCRAGQPPSA